MASRKEERERLRAEREQRLAEAGRQERKRLLLGYAVAGLISLVVVAGIVAVIIGGGDGDGESGGGDAAAAGIDHQTGTTDEKAFDERRGAELPPANLVNLAPAAKRAGCELRENLRDEGSTHIDPGEDQPEYETQPASSGDHAPEPQADGAYSEPLDPMRYIHALEHGRVAIAYSPDLPEEAQLELKGLFDSDPDGMLLFPDAEMPFEIASVAWTQHLGCETYEGETTLNVVRAFRDKWRGRGPEAFPI